MRWGVAIDCATRCLVATALWAECCLAFGYVAPARAAEPHDLTIRGSALPAHDASSFTAGISRPRAPVAPYAPSFAGRAVKFDLSGFEPDFDPIYSVVIAATLHDGRHGGVVVPDSTLVLDMYLEVFQPDTTPLLPDLLHPNQAATNLAGFLQGKAALVSAAGRIAYRGSLLAEIFQTNLVHIIVRLFRVGASTEELPLQLRGTFTLYKGGTEHGVLRATQALPGSALDALVVPRGPALSWQAAIGGMSVKLPRMMGTAGSHHPASPQVAHRATALLAHGPASSSPPLWAPVLGGSAVVVPGIALFLRRYRSAKSRRPTAATNR